MKLLSAQLNGSSISYLTPDSQKIIFQQFISGRIINSIVSSNKKQELLAYKQNIAKIIFASLNEKSPSSNTQYAISLSMRFSLVLHGNAKLDVENFTKPIIDGIAAGMFCPNDQDPLQITFFNYDDSNFNKLFVEKLSDCNPEDECLFITISQL